MAFGNLTVDYTRLSRLPARGRSELSRNLSASEIFGNMSPSDIAALFPDYYKDYLKSKSQSLSSATTLKFDDSAASASGKSEYGDVSAEKQAEPTVQEMEKALLEKGINVDETYNLIDQVGVLQGDKRIEHLIGASPEELTNMGFERFSDESGKTFIREMPTKTSTLTDEQVLTEYKKKFSSDSFTPRERATLDFISKREGSEDPNVIFGGEKYKSRLGLDKKPLTEHTLSEVFALQNKLREMTRADGYGRSDSGEILGTSAVGAGQMIEGTLRSNLKALGIKEEDFNKIKFDKKLQDQLTLQNFKSSGIGDPNADPSTWNQQRLGQQYESLNTRRGHDPMTAKEVEAIKSASPEKLAAEENISFAEAREKLEEQEKQQRKEEQTKFTYRNDVMQSGETTVSKTNTQAQVDPKSLGSYEYTDDREQFGLSGTAKQRGLKEVDARIVDIMEKTSKEFPLRVRLFSGKRDSGGHGAGVATDIQIFDEDGNPIGSYQTPQTSNIYAMFALKAREVQMREYPELKDKFVWGGSWPGMEKSGGGKYGAADWMDFRIGHSSQDTMAAFKWPDPSKPGEGGWQKGYEHYTEGDFLGIGNKLPTSQDFEKLKGFKLTDEQNREQYQLAQRIGANAGLLSQPNIGGRQLAGGEYISPVKPDDQTIKVASAETGPSLVDVVPNTVNPNLPGGETAMANKQDIKGVVFHKPGLSLEELKAGSDPRNETFGYNTAIVSTYVDKNGNSISEQQWKKLSRSEQQSYTEKAEVHQLRPEDIRPNQMKSSDSAARTDVGRELDNTNALGIVTVGQDSIAKQQASQKYLAQLIVDGKMSPDALSSVYGHGEMQPDEGRGTMDPNQTPEGSAAATAVRENTKKILEMAEDLKQQRIAQAVTAEPIKAEEKTKEVTASEMPEVRVKPTSQLPGTEPMTAMPLVDEKNKGDVPIMDLNPKMKLGGTQNFEEPNNVRESMSLNVNGQPVVEFNNKERAVVEDGQIKVENEFVRKTKEVQEMNDKGVQRNEFKMRQTVESVKTYPEQVKYGIVPESPSIARQTKMAQFGGYNHFSRGSKNA